MLGEKRVVEDKVEFRGAGSNAGTGFAQFGVGVLGPFVEADNSCYNNGGSFEVANTALYPVQADADRLRNVSRFA